MMPPQPQNAATQEQSQTLMTDILTAEEEQNVQGEGNEGSMQRAP
jgi:hypothetical protein